MSSRDASDRMQRLARSVGETLRARQLRLTTAESCTGGWIAKAITDIPGSSQWFDAAYVAYSDAAKRKMLRVKSRTLAAHGAVSAQIVREMARGALVAAGADIAIAVSGIAGPDGGTPRKPVGTVWFCWARRRGSLVRTRVLRRRFRGDRNAVRLGAVITALSELRRNT